MANDFLRELARYGPDATYAAPSEAEAMAYCRQLARTHYENFSVATMLLPRRLVPHFHVDTSETFAIKQAMLAEHASQREWLRAQHGVDEYLQSQARWSAARGAEIGVAHAEGFRQHLGHPYPHDALLAELLGARYRENAGS